MPKRLAVVVGINEYQDSAAIPPLAGAENDAKEVYERLTDPDPEFTYEVTYLTQKEATCSGIRQALSDVFWKTDETCDLALFYFSGHGFEDTYHGEGYIAPYDMLKAKPFVNGIKMSDLTNVISQSEHTCTLTILDCCYSGIAVTGRGSDSLKGDEFANHINHFVGEDFVGEGRIILASSAADETSREVVLPHFGEKEKHPHGALTYHLIEGLDSGREKFDALSDYVTEKLQQKCKSSLEGDTKLHELIIARSQSAKNAQKIEPMMKKVRSNYKDGYYVSAVRGLSGVMEYSRQHPEALDLIDKCMEKLKENRDLLKTWVRQNAAGNTYPGPLKIQLLHLADTLVSFDEITKLMDDESGLLEAMWQAANSDDPAVRDEFSQCAWDYHDNKQKQPEQIPVSKAQRPRLAPLVDLAPNNQS